MEKWDARSLGLKCLPISASSHSFLAVYHVVISVSSRDFDASGTSNAMFDELMERSLMSPLAGMKHTYRYVHVRIANVKFSHFFQVIQSFCTDN